ncbi:MAG: DNA recombination protein RmuC [Alphaproteobacteria bacterium MarineAlpha5_Bin11]|nr:hypothetical protein [Pelagibacteraceae bacterium]PPR43633.1 MAG: DNA recombination protein RmuC [Alphaproteobacteria bacterium MarineAlpha5_Bin11]PPR51999.1 MAG: DNA recombination protein RmuC [Alphaproteobacteria bacterium MarineAlpha5_Bin10]|tara:strand:- start:837 stop:1877 length:1041 start_codon:yes stop_codon:yes gene_type:complete
MFITYIIFSFVAGIIIASILYWTLRKKNGYRDPDKEIFFLKQSIDDLKKIFQEQKNEESKKIGVFEELTRNIQKSVDLINSDTIGLKNALVGGNRYQGKMGEMGLEILFQGYGWTEGKQYYVKKNYKDIDGQSKQPDFVVNLPEGKQLIIDCKISFDAWYRYINDEGSQTRDINLKDHIQSVLSHIRNLSEKNYEKLQGINSLDSVLMYMPNEEAFHAAASARNDIILKAGKNKVVIVGPSTLPVMITVIDQMWKIDQQSKNTQTIVERAHEIYDKARLMTEAFEEVKKSIENANSKINQATDRLTGRGSLLKKVESLKELGISPKKSIPDTILKLVDNEKERKSK